MDWQPLTSQPVIAARLQVVPDETVVWRTTRHFLFFPIADQVLACIQLMPSQLRIGSQEELDKRVSRSTMYELMEQIIDSFELKLSPQAVERQKAALEGLSDASLVKAYPPLKWDRDVAVGDPKVLEQ